MLVLVFVLHTLCISGKPDQTNPDWVPNLMMGQCEACSSGVDCYERAKCRKEATEVMLALQSKHTQLESSNSTQSEDITQTPPAEVSEVTCQTDESEDVVTQLRGASCSLM